MVEIQLQNENLGNQINELQTENDRQTRKIQDLKKELASLHSDRRALTEAKEAFITGTKRASNTIGTLEEIIGGISRPEDKVVARLTDGSKKQKFQHEEERLPCTVTNCGKHKLCNASVKLVLSAFNVRYLFLVKSFKRKADLQRHIKSHIKDLPCPHCGRLFGRKDSLNIHIGRCLNGERKDTGNTSSSQVQDEDN